MGRPRCISKHHFSIAFLSHQARTHAREARPRELRPASSCLIRLCTPGLPPRTSGRPSSCKLHPRQPLLHTPTSPARPRHTPPHSASPRSPIGSDAALPTYGLLHGFCPSRTVLLERRLHPTPDNKPFGALRSPGKAFERATGVTRPVTSCYRSRRDATTGAHATPHGARLGQVRAPALAPSPVRPLALSSPSRALPKPSQTLSNPLKLSQGFRHPLRPQMPRSFISRAASHRISPRTRTRLVGGIKA